MNKNSKKEQKLPNRVQEAVDAFTSSVQEKTDPLGSWTGLPCDRAAVPTQDADDL